MSDPQSYGNPVDEPKDEAHDVVGRAHEGLADAEAAQRDAVDPAEAAAAWEEREQDRPVTTTSAPAEATVHDASPVAPAAATDLDDEDARWAAYAASAEPETTTSPATDAHTQRYDVAGDTAAAGAAGGAVAAGAAAGGASSTPVASTTAYDTRTTEGAATASSNAYANQPIFVQAPEAPRPRGNRGAAGAIGLLAALCFAVLYLAATLGLRLLTGDIQVSGLANAALSALATWGLWVPTVAFYLGFWFLGALINRGRWGHWVVWGLVVGVIAWGGHLLGALFAAPFWMLTAREGVDLLGENVLAPLAIVAFVLGRELTIWFGAWVARRGRRVSELNDEAQREYERTLEAGPQVAVV